MKSKQFITQQLIARTREIVKRRTGKDLSDAQAEKIIQRMIDPALIQKALGGKQ